MCKCIMKYYTNKMYEDCTDNKSVEKAFYKDFKKTVNISTFKAF